MYLISFSPDSKKIWNKGDCRRINVENEYYLLKKETGLMLLTKQFDVTISSRYPFGLTDKLINDVILIYLSCNTQAA